MAYSGEHRTQSFSLILHTEAGSCHAVEIMPFEAKPAAGSELEAARK